MRKGGPASRTQACKSSVGVELELRITIRFWMESVSITAKSGSFVLKSYMSCGSSVPLPMTASNEPSFRAAFTAATSSKRRSWQAALSG